MSEFININLNDVDDGADPVPAGLRQVRVKSTERKHKQGSEYPYLDVRLTPLDAGEKFSKRQLFLTLSFHPAAQWNMKRFIKAAQVPFEEEGFDLNDFLGKELFVTVTHRPNENDPELVRAEVGPPYAKA